MRSNKDSISVTVLAVDITRKESEDVKNGADYDSPEPKLITSESNLGMTWPLLSFFFFLLTLFQICTVTTATEALISCG